MKQVLMIKIGILAGVHAEGEPLTAETANLTLREYVTRILSDPSLGILRTSLIALELANHIQSMERK